MFAYNVCVDTGVYVCMCVCMYVSVTVCICAYMYVSMNVVDLRWHDQPSIMFLPYTCNHTAVCQFELNKEKLLLSCLT